MSKRKGVAAEIEDEVEPVTKKTKTVESKAESEGIDLPSSRLKFWKLSSDHRLKAAMPIEVIPQYFGRPFEPVYPTLEIEAALKSVFTAGAYDQQNKFIYSFNPEHLKTPNGPNPNVGQLAAMLFLECNNTCGLHSGNPEGTPVDPAVTRIAGEAYSKREHWGFYFSAHVHQTERDGKPVTAASPGITRPFKNGKEAPFNGFTFSGILTAADLGGSGADVLGRTYGDGGSFSPKLTEPGKAKYEIKFGSAQREKVLGSLREHLKKQLGEQTGEEYYEKYVEKNRLNNLFAAYIRDALAELFQRWIRVHKNLVADGIKRDKKYVEAMKRVAEIEARPYPSDPAAQRTWLDAICTEEDLPLNLFASKDDLIYALTLSAYEKDLNLNIYSCLKQEYKSSELNPDGSKKTNYGGPDTVEVKLKRRACVNEKKGANDKKDAPLPNIPEDRKDLTTEQVFENLKACGLKVNPPHVYCPTEKGLAKAPKEVWDLVTNQSVGVGSVVEATFVITFALTPVGLSCGFTMFKLVIIVPMTPPPADLMMSDEVMDMLPPKAIAAGVSSIKVAPEHDADFDPDMCE